MIICPDVRLSVPTFQRKNLGTILSAILSSIVLKNIVHTFVGHFVLNSFKNFVHTFLCYVVHYTQYRQ